MQIKTIRDLMTTHYATVFPEQNVAVAVKILIDYHLSAIPVVDQSQRLVGVLSEADCLRVTLVEGYHNENSALVKDLMTDQPDTISPDAELSVATELFLNNRRRMIPVVEAGNLVGTLTRKDLLSALSSS